MEVQLTQGKTAIIDDSDAALVGAHRWRAALIVRRWYAVASVDGNNNTYLHRFITSAPRGIEVDHVDGDGLNCRRENLRLATRRQNAENLQGAHRDSLTGIRGVTFDKWAGRYRVQVVSNYQNHSGGYLYSMCAFEIFRITYQNYKITFKRGWRS